MTDLQVNGATRRVEAAASAPLLYALRNDLGLIGTRFGCGEGECGSCNVLLDGRAIASCQTPVEAAVGHDIITVEALAGSALAHAFADEGAAQCAYCVPGIIVTAAALLAADPDPSEAVVRAALDGNLCRCGAHNRMVRAVLRAAGANA